MDNRLANDIREITSMVHYQPAISVLMPLDTRMGMRAELIQQLKFKGDQLQRELQQKYSGELVSVVMEKFNRITDELVPDTKKKGLAIFVSPVYEKVLFLDMPVEERLIVNESFEIRDLVYAGKSLHRFLVLILSGSSTKTLLGSSSGFLSLKTGVPDTIDAFQYDVPERVSSFADPGELKENQLKRFLQQADTGLGNILREFLLPVFVLGTKKNIGYFKQFTKNEKQIAGYVQGNYENATDAELKSILQPYLVEWERKKRESLNETIEKAAGAGKLSVGIHEVWRTAAEQRGRLLIVEKNFMYPATHGDNQNTIDPYSGSQEGFVFIRDAVDDVIEKVLKNGGDVEFAEEGTLDSFQKIVLIQYY